MVSLNTGDLQKYIDDQGIVAEILQLVVDTPTVAETAVSQLTGSIYGGGGEIHALMQLTVAGLHRVVGNRTAMLVEATS